MKTIERFIEWLKNKDKVNSTETNPNKRIITKGITREMIESYRKKICPYCKAGGVKENENYIDHHAIGYSCDSCGKTESIALHDLHD